MTVKPGDEKAARIVVAASLKLVAEARLIDELVFETPSTVIDSVPDRACSWVSVSVASDPPRQNAATEAVLYCEKISDAGLMLELS